MVKKIKALTVIERKFLKAHFKSLSYLHLAHLLTGLGPLNVLFHMLLDLGYSEIALLFSPGLKQPRIHLFSLLISGKIYNRNSFKCFKILKGFNYSA